MSTRFKVTPTMLVTTLLALSPPSPVSASENLVSLYQKAVQYDAQYRSAYANTEAEREEINKARAAFFPKVQLSANIGKGSTDRTVQSSAGAVDNNFDYTLKNYALSIKQPLFNKEATATYRAAQAYSLSQEALLNKENTGLISRIAGAYFEMLYAQEKVSVTNNKIDAVQQQLKQAERRMQQGQGTITEINEAQANLDMAQAELIDANNTLINYKQVLSDISGQNVEEIAALNPDHVPESMPDYDSLEDWLKQVESNNSDVQSAQYALQAAQQDVERKQAGHYPTLDLVGVRSYSQNDNNNTIGQSYDSTTLSVQLNMPLYAGGLTSANIRQSQDRLQAAQEQLNLKSRDAHANVKKYFNNIQSGLRTIAAYQQAVKSNETALTGTQKSFTAGLRSNIEVLNAQQKLYEAKLELSRARYKLINDIVNLKQAAGMLDAAQLEAISHYFVLDEPNTLLHTEP
jgi:TolC family type I secretion outer membrane protein